MRLDRVEKPARYAGGELNSIKKEGGELDFALCFADTYEIGMSHLGIQILYEILNGMDGVYAQRVFCPWPDMIRELQAEGLPLASLEAGKPLCEFDIVGFNLSYEMCYSNVLLMLELGNIPLRAAERTDGMPVVIGGGACTVNPEPVADFFDLFVIGEGEEVTPELCWLYLEHKRKGFSRQAFLRDAAKIVGIYVPALYEVEYHTNGTIKEVRPDGDAPETVKKRFVADFNNAQTVTKPVLPYINTVHDRCTLEIMRGCSNGCRFCQAGFTMRPIRERDAETIKQNAKRVIAATGYDEISLCSLSSGDHSQIVPLIDGLISEFAQERVSVSLPSLRVDSFHFAKQLQQVRKTGLTFAPEAGTQRLRDVINKNITDEEIMDTVRRTFESGVSTIKLYFMIGLPTETMEDVDGIARLAKAIHEEYYQIPKQQRQGALMMTVSVSCFVPKPCTPFQWAAQEEMESLKKKQMYLKDRLKIKGVRYNYHDADVSFLEAVLARGDRRLGAVLQKAHEAGAMFDAWQEFFSLERYADAFTACGVDPDFYAGRERPFDEKLPWEHIDCRIDRAYMERECRKAAEEATTPACIEVCAACGLQKVCTLHGGESA